MRRAAAPIIQRLGDLPDSDYFTSFDTDENPISEGGRWVNGLLDGDAWSNVAVAGGLAYGSRQVDDGVVPRYADPIAHIKPSFLNFTPNQFAEGTVYRADGYSPASGHEVELYVRMSISKNPDVARGYEALWGVNGGCNVVRWNGSLGSFTDLGGTNIGVAVTGDVLRIEIYGTLIRVYKNGSLRITKTDATFTNGQPGLGFWPVFPDAVLASYGWLSFRAGNL